MFTMVENFLAERDYEIPVLDVEECCEEICQQILMLNPTAEERIIQKLILGRKKQTGGCSHENGNF